MGIFTRGCAHRDDDRLVRYAENLKGIEAIPRQMNGGCRELAKPGSTTRPASSELSTR